MIVAGVVLLALVLALSSCTQAEEPANQPAEETTEATTPESTTPETTTIDESTQIETVVVTPAPEPVDVQPPAPPSVPPPPAKELPKTGVPTPPVNPYQNCHTPGSGCEDIEQRVEAAQQAKPQITPQQQANRDRLAELQRNGTGTGDSPWVAHQKEIMAAK